MPRLRDGVIKRGGSWSYVIRVPDPATGASKPKWVGGFESEEAMPRRLGMRLGPSTAWRVRQSVGLKSRRLSRWMGGRARIDCQTQDARRIPARH